LELYYVSEVHKKLTANFEEF